jgi:hypothetical protein
MSDSRKRPSGPGAPHTKKTHASDERPKLPTDKIAEFDRVRRGLLQMLSCAAMAVDECDPAEQNLAQLASHLNAVAIMITSVASDRNRLANIIDGPK